VAPLSFFQTGKTAFLIAVLNGLLDVAKCLVKKGANKKAEDEVGTVRTLPSCSSRRYLNERRVCIRFLRGALPIREKGHVSIYGRMYTYPNPCSLIPIP
jgi:hypothetical protein